jgi:hypothetical protein
LINCFSYHKILNDQIGGKMVKDTCMIREEKFDIGVSLLNTILGDYDAKDTTHHT